MIIPGSRQTRGAARARVRPPMTMRACLACTVALGTLVFGSGAALAQGKDAKDVYFLRSSHEYADGHSTISTSQDIVVARARRGDRSMTIQDFQAGAVTVESANGVIAAPLASQRGVDAASTYDYAGVRASGSGPEVEVFNTYLRPLIARFPAAGNASRWTAQTTLQALGIAGQGPETPVLINLRREPVTQAGAAFVLIEFDIPAFAYRLGSGETVTHWARGIAVTDKDFAVIQVAATQHRATVIAADGVVRPFAVRTSLHRVAPDGAMALRLESLPEVAAAVRRLGETRGAPIMALSKDVAAETLPGEVAARLDLASFAIGEGGGNPLPVTTAPARPNPATALPPGGRQQMATFRAQAGEVLQANGMSGPDADRLLDAMLAPDPNRELIDRWDEFQAFFQPMMHMSANASERRNDGNPAPSDAIISQLVDIYIRQDNSLTIEARLTESRNRFVDKWVASGKSLDDPEYLEAMAEKTALQEKILNQRYQRMLEHLRITTEEDSDNSASGNQLVPGWISDGGNPNAAEDEALYDMLKAEMERELAEAEAIIKELEEAEKRRERGVYDDTDDFFLNNAFDYSRMVGTVATDLSKWGEWLATQNKRELERLALQAGYPNLASALNDAQNILRQSQDTGYRRWAMQPPSCNGFAGCGPSYLERWSMKQSIVALGDILNDSRDIFSTGGFSDIGISGLDLDYLLRDHALEDGDIVRVRISQFGRVIYEGEISLTNRGQLFDLGLGKGVASLEIFAVNEGYSPPNTAQITVDNVVRGEGTQTYSLRTGETATLRIEAGAKAAAPGGTP